ncbi:helix-hairpin-helix domain-containing protein [Bacillus infantis]|uniref:helix-hairpin-helix domain-containing protein n=1 Tax=Bacillus infantis TaxID=324767 RepID=UPI00215507B4|nr:helix-hairpin-helix domain-containing protein [Bacillus infantis]MCR6612057.1 helix-hairpin-helix domain-containing protein [Bacillus infantis]
MLEWIKHRPLAWIGAVLISILLFYFFLQGNSGEEDPLDSLQMEEELESLPGQGEDEEGEEKKEKESAPLVIKVDVKGSVRNPGLYEAAEGERVADLIQKAGGLTENADETRINFAQRVGDEMVIYVPEEGEELSGGIEPAQTISADSGEDGMVNINSAGSEELQDIPGIGPSKAAAIIEYRETEGPFQSLEDLMQISGIGEKTFEKLKSYIKLK